MTYQLADAHDHRRNVAEKAIQTFKDHFASVLCGTDDSFPMHLWDRLLEQAEHQLNMLRPSRVVPTISAYTQLYGTHDYNRHPFAPLGCKIQVHEMPSVRKSWDVYTVTGWYIGVSWEHYRNHRCWIQETRSERSCPTVFFKHKYLTMPTMTPADALIKAADNLNEAIQGVIPEKGQTQEAIKQLMQIFKQEAKSAHNGADSQRVLMEESLSQRVQTNEVTKNAGINKTPQDSANQESK